jgi:hypothetical protein
VPLIVSWNLYEPVWVADVAELADVAAKVAEVADVALEVPQAQGST